MNLHRANGQPEWASVEPGQYNFWQRIAARTRGYVTLGNLTTLVGLALVVFGLAQIVAEDYWLGGVLVIVGRLLDLVDGWLADITRTKSPLGEIADAGADKIETFAAIGVLFVATLAPWWLLVALILPHVGISIIAYVARIKNIQLHPSRLGKISMALLWVALFGFIIAKVVDSGILSGVVYGVAVVSVLTTLYAAAGYAMSLMRKTY